MPYSVDLVLSRVLIGFFYVMCVVPTFTSLRYGLENCSRLPALINSVLVLNYIESVDPANVSMKQVEIKPTRCHCDLKFIS